MAVFHFFQIHQIDIDLSGIGNKTTLGISPHRAHIGHHVGHIIFLWHSADKFFHPAYNLAGFFDSGADRSLHLQANSL